MGWVFSNQALCTGIPSSRHDLPSPAYTKCNIGTHHLQERPCSYIFSARASGVEPSEILKTPPHITQSQSPSINLYTAHLAKSGKDKWEMGHLSFSPA